MGKAMGYGISVLGSDSPGAISSIFSRGWWLSFGLDLDASLDQKHAGCQCQVRARLASHLIGCRKSWVWVVFQCFILEYTFLFLGGSVAWDVTRTYNKPSNKHQQSIKNPSRNHQEAQSFSRFLMLFDVSLMFL